MTLLRLFSPLGWLRITAGLLFTYVVALLSVWLSGGRWLPHQINLALVVVLAVAVICSAICAVAARQQPRSAGRRRAPDNNPRLRFLPPLQAVPGMPAAPVWAQTTAQHGQVGQVYGAARPVERRLEEDLFAELARDTGDPDGPTGRIAS